MLKELRSVLALAWGHFVIDVYSPVIPAVLPLLIATHGWSYAVAGLLVAGFNITSSILQPFVGWLADRRGIVVPFSIPFLIASICIGVFGFIGSYPILLICACLAAFGAALYHPSAMAMVNRLTRTENRGRLTSIFVIGGNLGFALGPVLAGLAVGAFGLQGLLFLAIPGLLMAALFGYLLPAEETRPTADTAEERDTKTPVSLRPITMVVGVGALRSWAIFAAVAFLPTYIHATLEVDLLVANTIVSLMLVAGVVGQYVGGALSDTYGRKEYTFLGLAASVPPFLLFLTAGGVLSYVGLLLFGFFLWSTFSVTVAMGQEVMPGNAGLASGLMLGLAVGAGGVGVVVSGAIADAVSLDAALATLPVPIIAAALLTLFIPYPWVSFRRRARAGSR